MPFGDPISISATVNNLGNADIVGLAARISIVDPAAQQVLADFPATLSLARQQSAPLSFAWPARGTVGNTYVAVLSAMVGTASVTLAQDSFKIAPPVTRVTGTLAAIPNQVPQGDSVAFSLSVTNAGFGAIAGLPLTVSVADSATGQVVAQFADSANIVVNDTYQKAFSWQVTGAVGTNYVATLTATVDGIALTLAQAGFVVVPPPVRLEVTLERVREARVLALVSCRPEHAHDGREGGGHDEHRSKGNDKQRRAEGRDMHGDAHDEHDDDEACSAQRGAFLERYLTGLGITHRVTNTEADFRKAFRSGAYNTYWIAGGAEKLRYGLEQELREAVYRGDALLVDRLHDERNRGLDAILGVSVRGKLGTADQTVNVSGPIFAAGSIVAAGRPLKVELTTGQAQAVFQTDPKRPAIVANQYGQGRSLLFAFDLVGTLIGQPGAADLEALSRAGLGWLAPDVQATVTAGGYSVIRARVANLALPVDMRVTLALPEGTSLVNTVPSATLDTSGQPVWTTRLETDQAVDLAAAIRAALTAGTYTVQAQVDSIRNGQTVRYNTYALALAVTDAATSGNEAIAGLQALALTDAERRHRDRAVAHLESAQAKLAQNLYAEAIGQLLEAADHLAHIRSVDVSALRLGIDRMLQEAGYRWFLAQP